MNLPEIVRISCLLSLPFLAPAHAAGLDRKAIAGPEAHRLYDASRADEEQVFAFGGAGAALCKVEVGFTCTARQTGWDARAARVILDDYRCELQLGERSSWVKDYAACGAQVVALAPCQQSELPLSCSQPTGPRCLFGDDFHALACGVGAAYRVVVGKAEGRSLPDEPGLLKRESAAGCWTRCEMWTEGAGGKPFTDCMNDCLDGKR